MPQNEPYPKHASLSSVRGTTRDSHEAYGIQTDKFQISNVQRQRSAAFSIAQILHSLGFYKLANSNHDCNIKPDNHKGVYR